MRVVGIGGSGHIGTFFQGESRMPGKPTHGEVAL